MLIKTLKLLNWVWSIAKYLISPTPLHPSLHHGELSIPLLCSWALRNISLSLQMQNPNPLVQYCFYPRIKMALHRELMQNFHMNVSHRVGYRIWDSGTIRAHFVQIITELHHPGNNVPASFRAAKDRSMWWIWTLWSRCTRSGSQTCLESSRSMLSSATTHQQSWGRWMLWELALTAPARYWQIFSRKIRSLLI